MGDPKRRERRHTCEHCHKPFVSSAFNAKFCQDRECKADRQRVSRKLANERRQEEYRSRKNQRKSTGRRCQFEFVDGRICGKPTGVNRFFCQDCLDLNVDDCGMI